MELELSSFRRANGAGPALRTLGPLCVLGILIVQPSAAQTPEAKSRVTTEFVAGFQHQFRSDLDSGGDFGVSRFAFSAAAGIPLTESLDLNLRLRYEFSGYDFEGETRFGFAEDNDLPWRAIHSLWLSPSLTYRPDERWLVMGAPIVRFAGEAEADAEDALSSGGYVAAAYKFSDRLVLGAGLGAMTQIEDDTRLFPVLIVEWRILERLRLTTSTATLSIWNEVLGAELIWTPPSFDQWEIALGASYASRRFRLADDNIASPGGVGEETGLPAWLRVSFKFSKQFELDFYAGLRMGGTISLTDPNGREIADNDFNATPIFGVALRAWF